MDVDPSTPLRFARDDNAIMPKIQIRLILIILFLLPAYLVKIKLGWASFNLLELLITILFAFWIFDKQKKYLILYTKYFLPVALIFIGLILSILANKNYYSGLGAIKGWFVFPVIFATIFLDALKKDGNLLKRSLLALFYSGAAVSAIGLVYEILGILTFDDRLRIFWDSPNQLAMFLAIPFLMGVSRLEKSGFSLPKVELSEFLKAGLWKTPAIFFGSALIFINLYFAKSFGAWLGIVVALTAILWLKYKEKISKKYLLIFAMISALFLGLIFSNKYQQIQNLGERSSLASRAMIWQSAVLMIKNDPLFGIGPGNFQSKYLEYQKYFPPYLEWSAPQPHNIFLAFWLQSGLIGLAGFIWLLILFFRDNKIAIKNNHDLGILFLEIMICILVHGLIDTTYWRNDLAVVFWMIIAANVCSSGPSAEL